ncbi:MAG TPA: triacylglycerol lipase [Polyangia bacterium]|nr:triacylglycerol lipase [Polyangia bacterium]
MKRVPFVASLATLGLLAAGCSSSMTVPGTTTTTSTGTGGNAAPPPPTTWPVGVVGTGTPRAPTPIILAHGFSGFQNIGPIDYFYGVADALRKDGHPIYVTQVDPYNDSTVRGAELLTQVQAILDETGADHVILIGHSQGALDVRYVANKLGKKVGAAVLVAGVNRGTPVADIAEGDLPGSVTDALAALLQLFGETILDPGQSPDSNAQAAIKQLTTAGSAAFTAAYPDSPDVDYYSIAGRSNDQNGDIDCGTDIEPGMIGQWDGVVDDTQVLLAATGALINGSSPIPPTNDALVPVYSAKWGTFLGCVPADHMEEVCQLAGTPTTSGFNCVDFYRTLVNWLVARGY